MDLVIALLIIAIPFIFYIYQLFPEESVINTDYIYYELKYYDNLYYFSWIILSKLIIVGLFCIWYLTSNNEWKKFILIPIFIENFRIISCLNDEFKIFESVNLFELFIISLLIFSPIFFLIQLLSRVYHFKNEKVELISMIKAEIEQEMLILNRNEINEYLKIRSEYRNFQKGKSEINSKASLFFLMNLRERLRALIK